MTDYGERNHMITTSTNFVRAQKAAMTLIKALFTDILRFLSQHYLSSLHVNRYLQSNDMTKSNILVKQHKATCIRQF